MHTTWHLIPSGGERTTTVVAAALASALSLGVAATAVSGVADAAAPNAVRRVDLGRPVFSNPTNITNPLFPISALDQVVQLGAEGDVALRHEITLLDETRVIRWNGQDIETVVSQFLAYGDGEILEVATDYFAQADDGSVWYLGEDVANYEAGKVADHHGTWLAGRDGTAGMIMPANPHVGDVYRPENIPGLVFEEVTVKQTNLTVGGPTGPVAGAIRVQEQLFDGTLEDKIFAPGYGEFEASVPASAELVTVAVAVPTDEIAGREPQALDGLSDSAEQVLSAGKARQWSRVASFARKAHRAWDKISTSEVPPLLADQVDGALEELDAAVSSRSRGDTRQAAIALGLATLDIELQYDEVAEVDEDRIDIWRIQRRMHVAAGDTAAAASDRAIITAIRDRLST